MFPKAGSARPATAIATLLATALIGACSPTFNWREVRPTESGIGTLMPCKPETAERAVPLGPTPVVLHMSSCDTGGLTYALAWAELGEGVDPDAAQSTWESASRQSLRAVGPGTAVPVNVPGAAMATKVTLAGQNHQGKTTDAQVTYIRQGRRLYQAAVYGHPLPEDALGPFFDNLRVTP